MQQYVDSLFVWKDGVAVYFLLYAEFKSRE